MIRKYLIVVLIFGLCVISLNAKDKVVLPEEMVIIAQSCTSDFVFISAIDLSNNELVLITYYITTAITSINKIVRTGVIIDPKKQSFIMGKDAPFTDVKSDNKK